MTIRPAADPLLSAGHVAVLAGVSAKTVVRWAKIGRLPESQRTLGLTHHGHRRWRESEVRKALGLPPKEATE